MPSKQAILEYLSDSNSDPSRRGIARAFGVKGEARADLRSLLKEMEEDGLLDRDRGKRLRAQTDMPPVLPVDVIAVDDDGELNLAPSSWREASRPPRIFLTRKEAAKARPTPGVGDRLLVRISERKKNVYAASVIRTIGKAAPRTLGVFKAAKFGGVVEPVDKRARGKMTVDKPDTMGAVDGDLVWVEAVRHRGRHGARARVKEIAGRVDDRSAFSEIALAAHGIPTDMPAAALEEAAAARLPGPEGRIDLRDRPLLTIDPADAKDHDDAVWAAPDDDPQNPDGFIVIVAIADVSWFVKPGSALDREARRRGNSVYLPDRVVPMLPERLSNNLCSLREGEDRPCLAVELRLAADGRKLSQRFMRATMRSAAKLSYEAAQAIIDAAPKGDRGQGQGTVETTIRHLYAAFQARWREREKRAPLDLDLPERKIVFDENGFVAGVEVKERLDAHRLIEEFMILANVAAAETLERRKTPQIYRVHDTPDPERLQATREYLETLDYSLVKGGSLRPMHFNQLLSIARQRDQIELVSEVVLRSQRQAIYDTENLGHFGLNLARYSHFTSPIRRYADLIVHRALVRALNLGPGGQTDAEAQELQRVAEDISDLERRAMAAERESKDRFLASFLADRVGETFEARIRGVTRFGIFVALEGTGADGFVPMRALGHERFNHEEAVNAVIGERSKRGFRLGQKVDVRLEEAAPVAGGLRFDMLSDPIEIARPKAALARDTGSPRRTATSKSGTKSKTCPKPQSGAKREKPRQGDADAGKDKPTKKRTRSNAKSRKR
ncbi:MAG: ribonuclease R [Alphaproteobacteria bacterium]|nr:ribonuclease R [Alphaproteobacteria bacterium]